MDPRPKTKKQRRRDNEGYQPDLGLLPSSPKRSPKHSSMSHPIDISGDESQITNLHSKEVPRPAYRGTARQQPTTGSGTQANTSKTLKDRPGATQSPYFNRPGLPPPRSTGNVKQKLIAQSSTRERSPGLAQKFVAMDGKRRGSDVNASSDADELQSVPTTVGQNADPNAVFSAKDMGSKSPSKQSSSTLKATSSTDDLVVWAPSTIKSDFVGSDAKSGNPRRPSRPVPLDQETKPPWSVDLAAISLPGNLFKDEGLALVYDERESAYFIHMCGSRYRSTHSSLRIHPQKLIKVLWENSGSKVRFESSRTGTEDNVLDLELRSERGLQDLLRRLQISNNFPVRSKNRYVIHGLEQSVALYLTASNSEHMQKIFDRRRLELARGGKPDKMEIVSNSKQRSNSSSYRAPLDIENVSRPQLRSSIVDELRNTPHNTDTAGKRPETRIPVMPNGYQEESGIEKLLERLRPAHNEHLRTVRRSTRKVGVLDDESLLSNLEGVPEKEKYSVKHGLGDPWKKALTYPNVGKKKTTVEWSDLERLDEGEFLNDNLIGFYLRYLEQRLEEERPELAKRVYFFNTFFFATLTNAHKGRKRFNYEGVQKWTRSVDLFTYDYIIVPINEQAHWYLAIICNLPALDHDLALHDDMVSSPNEEGRAILKQGPGQTEERASSPKDQPRGSKSDIPIPNAEEPSERETRTSFSQMSLENGVRLSTRDEIDPYNTDGPEKARPSSEDKDMLDSQIEDTMPEFTASKEAKNYPVSPKNPGAEVEDPMNGQDEGVQVVAKSKKGKRKSLPAPITKVDPRKPAIITFDSLGQTRSQTIRILKDYLREEAKAKRSMDFGESQIKGINAKRIPQQDNFSDCGVFLLGYVDTFLGLETNPKDFITKTIQQTHEEKDWPKLVPGNLRASIRDQVRGLHEIQTNERREESAVKSRKVAGKEDKKLISSPSRAYDQPRPVEQQHIQSNVAEKVPTTTSKALEDEVLETALHCKEDSDMNHDNFEKLLRASERDFQKSAEYQRLYNSDDVDLGVHDEEASAIQRDDPSIIMVNSQSQTRPSAPTSITCPSPSSGKQGHFESTSARVVDPTRLSFENEDSPTLPSEIPDSQSSFPDRKSAEIVNQAAATASHANPDPAKASANPIDVFDCTQELLDMHGERTERSKRRKISRQDRRDLKESSEQREMVFTIERSPEPREGSKEPPKSRKRPAKETAKVVERSQVHVIDD